MKPLPYFFLFESDVQKSVLPNKFTFPFYYNPHDLSEIASKKLQDYLENQSDFQHNFGLNPNQSGLIIGKMFGVLVCQNRQGQIGYLWAFSGKLGESNAHKMFVPTIFDMLPEDGFYKIEEEQLNILNRKIEELEKATAFLDAKNQLDNLKKQALEEIQNQKLAIKNQKTLRDDKRKIAEKELAFHLFKELQKQFSEESKQASILLKQMTKFWNFTIANAREIVSKFEKEIQDLKEIRKNKSKALQLQLFDQYMFLNSKLEQKTVGEIFENNPPAGAGECALPKLLQYAYQNELKPIAMAEFWWGTSPKSELKKHKNYYPACKSKCEPILAHMLKHIDLEANPFLENTAINKEIEVVFEDEHLAVIHKPAEMLSVPGKNVKDSVYQRVFDLYPNATGPLVVHRLDMSTSGLLLIAKSEAIYKALQSQFIKRTIKKTYVALLDGVLTANEGEINLPLRLDIENRPYQVVCYDFGKQAKTKWKKIEEKDGKTRVHFYPISGRTHQLRVHASHKDGLNCAIIGDDLYGSKSDRLYLHAEEITFEHPISKEEMTIFKAAEF